MRALRCIFTLLCSSLLAFASASPSGQLRHPAPVPNFTISHFCLGDTAYFTNTTIMPSTYIWEIDSAGGKNNAVFSQIYTSTDTNISYFFTHPGTYKIILTADNGHIVTINRIIVIDSVTTANFAYQDCGSQFVNMSVCYDSCYWNFGDGHTSTEDSPIHFYDTVGTYFVTMIATRGAMSDTIADSVIVYTTNSLDGSFSSYVEKDSVLFMAHDTVSGAFTQYHWSFGDGEVADLYFTNGGHKIRHSYARKDTSYTVFLLVKTTCLNAFSQGAVFVPDSTPVSGTYIYPNPVADNILTLATDDKQGLQDMAVIDNLGQPVSCYGISEITRGVPPQLCQPAAGMLHAQAAVCRQGGGFEIHQGIIISYWPASG